MLALVAIAVRLPFRSEFLVNWDAVNFALGISSFDLATHQPHPPGYLGWVALSRAANTITNDPNAAMTLLSAVSGAVATGVLFLLARRYASRRASVVAALLFSTAPLIWYYSVVALSYMTIGAVAMVLLYTLVRALEERSSRYLLVAGVVLAVIGALRPTDQVLLGSAWLVVAWTFSWRTRIRAALVMGVASLAWIVPLLWLSGGVGAFRGESSAVAGLAGGRTWILGGNLAGMGQNLGMVAAGLLLGLFGGLAVLLVARTRGIRPYGELPDDQRRLLVAWVAPPLFVYLALHTGQLGYVILLLPVVYLGVARALHPLGEQVREMAALASSLGLPDISWKRPVRLVGALLVLNAVAFLSLPATGQRVLEYTAAATAAEDDDRVRPASLDRTRQYDLPANDEHWRVLTDFIEGYDESTTAVVAETTSAGSFRHLSYYVPDHRVYGVGWDRRQDLGFLFTARDRQTTYSVERLEDAVDRLVLPGDVRTVLIPDSLLTEHVEADDRVETTTVELSDGTEVLVVRLDDPSVIEFSNPGGTDELGTGFPVGPGDREEDPSIWFRPADEVFEGGTTPAGSVPDN